MPNDTGVDDDERTNRVGLATGEACAVLALVGRG